MPSLRIHAVKGGLSWGLLLGDASQELFLRPKDKHTRTHTRTHPARKQRHKREREEGGGTGEHNGSGQSGGGGIPRALVPQVISWRSGRVELETSPRQWPTLRLHSAPCPLGEAVFLCTALKSNRQQENVPLCLLRIQVKRRQASWRPTLRPEG